jgi:hypothetical protein
MLYVGVYKGKDTSNVFQVKIMAIVIKVYGMFFALLSFATPCAIPALSFLLLAHIYV